MDLLITPHPPHETEQIPMKTNRKKTALAMMALAAALAAAPLAAAAKPSRALDYTKTPNRYVDVEGTRYAYRDRRRARQAAARPVPALHRHDGPLGLGPDRRAGEEPQALRLRQRRRRRLGRHHARERPRDGEDRSTASNLAQLEAVKQPVLVVNGSKDVMAPTRNSVVLYEHIPNAQLSLYPDSGHGALFQHHDLFVSQVATFLDGVR